MSDDKNEDIGFTEAQQEWIRKLVASQRRDVNIPPTTTSSSQSGTPCSGNIVTVTIYRECR